MEKIAKFLTGRIIPTSSEEEKELYVYGVQIGLEGLLCILVSVAIMFHLEMIIEGIIFFVIFIPLRFYAGGIHLKNYFSCFIVSCLTFYSILFCVKTISITSNYMIVLTVILLFAIYMLNNDSGYNTELDSLDAFVMEKHLKVYIVFDLIVSLIVVSLNMKKMLFLITLVLGLEVISLILEKIVICKIKK